METQRSPEPMSHEDKFQRRFSGRASHTETGEILHVGSTEYEDESTLSFKGVYEHYKSTPEDPKLYYVGKLVRHRETEECLVLYVPLYGESTAVYARPLGMFAGSVVVDGEDVPRFCQLTDQTTI